MMDAKEGLLDQHENECASGSDCLKCTSVYFELKALW